MITLIIDGKEVKTKRGLKILETAQEAGIYIPNLCFISNSGLPFGGCRLCLIEIKGRGFQASCSQPAEEGMVVYTQTPEIKRLRRTIFELLISDHPIECKGCGKKGKCELVRLASYLGLKLKSSERLREFPQKSLSIDSSHFLITYDPNKCILCGKCVSMCEEKGSGVLDFASRGYPTRITTFGNIPLGDSRCNGCGECVRVCPSGAFSLKD